MSNMSSSQQHHHHHPKNPHSLRHSNKKRLNQNQVRILEANFTSNKKLEPERKLQLARQLGVPPRQVAIWYQNKRARWKNQSLELDYSALQLRLESALDEKKQLEREVAQLQGELQRTRETLFSCAQQPQQDHQVPPCLNDDVSCAASWQNGGGHGGHGLQLDELYAWLMGGADQGSARASVGQQHEKAFLV